MLQNQFDINKEKELLYSGLQSRVYLVKVAEEIHILKHPSSAFPSVHQIARMRKEYEIGKGLSHPNVRKVIDYQEQNGQCAVLMDYFQGMTLSDFLKNNPSLSLRVLLRVAIQLTEAIQYLHEQKIIHRDVKPANVLINPTTYHIQLIDLGAASKLAVKQTNLGNPDNLEGTLHYISPEQTGRMNRFIDYRTDLYSLGVSLYEMFVGVLPFQTNNSMELIHAHIALNPKAPHELKPDLPVVVSSIILKLLNKNAEDRYWSAQGLVFDLKNCLKCLEADNTIEAFEICQQDFSEILQVSEKLYGREQETQQILTAFDRMTQGNVVLTLIEGHSGTGKSVLVNQTHRLLPKTRGYFIEGKFGQYERNVPFSAWIEAFKDFVELILTEKEEQLNYWRKLILKALGQNGSVLTKVVPNLEAIIGTQPPVPELGGQEALNRFNYLVQRFVTEISKAAHPLVIFIDDLQWADGASLQLLHTLITDTKNKYLLCLGAFRDNEISATHPLTTTLSKIEEEVGIADHIKIKNLDIEAIIALLSDTLNRAKDDVLIEFAYIILAKTQGNAFFIHQFLKNLNEDKLLQFSYETQQWHWDIGQIEQANFTDNVVDFMADRVAKLPIATQKIMQLAACAGSRFEMETLSIIAKKSARDLEIALEAALIEGFFVPLKRGEYKFTHDRIQQAAYSLIPPDQKDRTHLSIAQLLYEKLSEEELDKQLFKVTNQYNLANNMLSEGDKKVALQLNIKACKKAKMVASFDGMQNSSVAAQALLPTNSWELAYQDTLRVYMLLAEASFLNADFDTSEKMMRTIIQRAQENIEKADAYLLLVVQQSVAANYQTAMELGIEALRLLGLAVPKEEALEAENNRLIQETISLMENEYTPDEIVDLPHCDSREIELLIELCASLDPPSYIAGNINLYIYVSVKIVELSLKNGNVPFSCKGYANFGLIVGSMLGNYPLGYQIGQASLALADKFEDKSMQCQTALLMGNWVGQWASPLKEGKAYNLKGIQTGLEAGEIQFAMYNVFCYVCNIFAEGQSLNFVKKEIEFKYWELSMKYQNGLNTNILLAIRWAINVLNAEQNAEIEVANILFTEEQFEADCIEANISMALCVYYVYKAQALLIMGDIEGAFLQIEKTPPHLAGIFGFTASFDHNFYTSLVYLKKYEQSQEAHLLETVNTNQTQMQGWAKNCPENFQHKYVLVQAEYARISHQGFEEILHLYDEAAELAQANGFKQDAALANECCAAYLMTQQKQKYAKACLEEAYQLYRQWGASGKLAQLVKSYPDLEQNSSKSAVGDTTGTFSLPSHQTSRFSSDSLDIQSVFKAAQALSQEVNEQELLAKIVHILEENAGAQKAVFIHRDNEQWLIKAISDEQVTATPYRESKLIPIAILNYIERTQKSILLNKATNDSRFSDDTYISTHEVKSVLAMPIQYQGQTKALIYLENNLSEGVFTPKHMEVIQLVASQMVISMDNASLYTSLEQKVAKRTEEIQGKNRELANYNKHVTESIRYAKRMQNSILPTTEKFKRLFSDHFVIYEPKDIVSGDFYWLNKVGEYTVLIVADCTGHGVPGAFMSMIGNTLINEIVNRKQVTDPAKILGILNVAIWRTLQQGSGENRDGMDIGVTVFRALNEEQVSVAYASAKQRLYYTSDKGVMLLKGERQSVGGDQRDKHFETISFVVPKETTIFMSTDGIYDLPDPNRKSFGTKRLIELLGSLKFTTLAEQKLFIEEELANFAQGTPARDDITLIGIKL